MGVVLHDWILFKRMLEMDRVQAASAEWQNHWQAMPRGASDVVRPPVVVSLVSAPDLI